MWFILVQFTVPELNQHVLNETQHVFLKSFKITVFNFLRIYVMLDGVDVAFILKIQIITYPASVSIKFTFFRAWKGDIL
jgi:hypothetical protein